MRGFAETGKQQQRKGPVELLDGQTASAAGPVRPRAGGNRLFQTAMGKAPARPAASVPRRNVNDAPIELLAPEPKPVVAARTPPPAAAAPRAVVQEQASSANASFGIKGAANPQMKVLIEGLVQGTTAVDVEVGDSLDQA